MSNFKKRIVSLKLNVKQHQDQIKILLKEIKDLENYKNNNSNDNSTIDNSTISNDNIIDNFCISTDDKILSKNENLNKFI
jgi:hypothetical protein